MRAKPVKVMRVETTPRQLHDLANRLEKRWQMARLGDEIPKEVIYGIDCEVWFVVDQEETYAEERCTLNNRNKPA